MNVIGYLRVSTESQDLSKQRHLLLEYAHQQRLHIDHFVEIEASSRKSHQERRLQELESKLQSGDLLLVAELSRLGRNMLETLTFINHLNEQGVKITFVRQPELSTNAAHAHLLLAIYGYFAQAEREFISLRTKQGLAAARAQGRSLGRPKGSRNKERPLDPYHQEIKAYLQLGLPIASIQKLINKRLEEALSYNSYKYFIATNHELYQLWKKEKPST